MRSPCTGRCRDNTETNRTCGSHHGIQYSSVYYEEQLSGDNLDTANEHCKHQEPCCVPSPVRISRQHSACVDMPPIKWYRYNYIPKTLHVINTGRTILINGEWSRGKPYIEGGPLNGTYIFSQIHFHCPSEHEIDGERYPLEMHVVHHKTSYLTQERAMYEKDGIVVLVYFFQVLESEPTPMSSFTRCAPQLEQANSQVEAQNVPLEDVVQPFTSNYYIYWGSVTSNKKSYWLQWILSGSILSVTKKEADELFSVMNFEDSVGYHPPVKPENDAVYFVQEIEDVIEVIKEPQKMIICPGKEESEIAVVKGEPRTRMCCTHCGTQICWDNTNSFTATCSLPTTTDNTGDYPAKKEKPCHSKSEEVYRQGKLSGLQVKFCYRKKMLKNNCKNKKFLCFKRKTLCKKRKAVCVSPKADCEESCKESVPEIICYEAPEEKKKKKKNKKSSSSCKCANESTFTKECEQTCEYPETTESKTSKGSCSSKKKKRQCASPCTTESKTSKESCSSKKKKKKKKKKQCASPCTTESKTSKESCSSKKKKKKKKKKQCASPCTTESKTSKESCSSKEKKKQCVSPGGQSSELNATVNCETKKKEKKKKKKKKKNNRCDDLSSSSASDDYSSCEEKQKPCEIEPPLKICCAPCPEEERVRRDPCEDEDSCEQMRKVERQMESPVNCMLATISPEKTFNEILNGYTNQSWLEDSKIFSDSNLCSLSGTDLRSTKTPVSLRLSGDSGTAITTLFEKKRSNLPDPPTEKCQSFSDSLSNGCSSSVMDTKYESEIKYVFDQPLRKSQKEPQLTVNSVIVTSPDEGRGPGQSEHKDFCIQVELLFRSRNQDFSNCLCQEYNLTLICDQNILQEYKGTLYPGNLVLGNYEKLTLLPKYPEVGDFCIQLQDCTVKMESMDQICMRAKFVFKKTNINTTSAPEPEARRMVTDAHVQCDLRDFESFRAIQVAVPRNALRGDLKSLWHQREHIKEKIGNVISQKPSTTSTQTVEREVEGSDKCESNEQLIFNENMSGSREVRVKLLKSSSNDEKGNSKKIVFDSIQRPTKSDKKVEQTDKHIYTENPDKGTKDITPNQKKTIYFTCEKIEMDPNTGKKIFVGSFRKEEVKALSKEKKKKVYSINGGESLRDLISPQSQQNEESTSGSLAPSDIMLRREEIKSILQRASHKHQRNRHKQEEPSNLVVGKLIEVSKGSTRFKRLSDLLGASKLTNNKISVYELQKPSGIQDLSLFPHDRLTVQQESSSSYSGSPHTDASETEASERDLGKNKSNTKPSKKAVVVIPVRAKSFSKIEVILVEHKTALNTNVSTSEGEIPCLKYDH